MKQDQFERNGRARWEAFGSLLRELQAGDTRHAPEFPHLYRSVCQDLALARDRAFSELLIERLNALALRGHEHLYRARGGEPARIRSFLASELPRAVRAEWRLLLFASVFFYGLAAALAAGVLAQPELVYSFMEPGRVMEYEEMYDPSNARLGRLARDASDDMAMFGFYIWNNVSIAFRTFASGLIFGIGSLFFLSFNAVHLGLVFGHLTNVGSLTPLATFVVAHGAFELTALVLACVAGMRLGLALVAPRDRTRLGALREAAARALPLVYGAAAMDIVAAAIEAFWSPRPLATGIKLGVGAALWGLVGLYLLLAGRTRAD